ncbi:MAG: DUF4837 family protein [Bacteroidales bacterium]|nr:DUF4837 family protein [Bacteroidales bacterium]MDD2280524.1 DUF4837 family protein [Bacteroidales bacterium]MDD4292486.1 DUF4837 family protein [Bacteroidales bacterium]MDD4491762.1 DUF4837 family protein [Bacteroidales bacterium]HNW48794.1 DUF4837 family protein [Bacteroidales bacterium]
MKAFKIFLAIFAGVFITSCKSSPKLMPSISGKAGEVVVVINKTQWESDPGIALRSILAVDQAFLPQKEPLFTLVNIPENAFASIFQSHRNLILVNITDKAKESKIVYQENVWAAPQIAITISAPDSKSAAEIILKEKDKLENALLQAERNRNIQNAKKYEEISLRNLVTETFGGSPFFPSGYNLRKKTENFIWISYETTYVNQGIFIYKFPFKDSTDFSKENLIAKRNEMLKQNVPGQLENTFMTTYLLQEPGIRWINYNKRNFVEIRGLWEVENDFMGGPFISHFFLDKDGQNIIGLEAFVYAPRYPKRNYLRQVESIIYSFEFF